MSNKKPLVVSIMGKAGAGKDTLADIIMTYIANETYYTYEHLSHADPLRDIAVNTLGYSRESVTDQRFKNIPHPLWDKSARETLVLLGTEMFRNIYDENTWTKLMKKRIDESDADIIIVTDCRFVNEAEYLNKSNTIHVHVVRDVKYLSKTYNILRWFMYHNQWVYRIFNKLGFMSFRWHKSELLNLSRYEDHRIYNTGDMRSLKEKTFSLYLLLLQELRKCDI